MSLLHNPALVKECRDVLAAIHADAHFTPPPPSTPSPTRPKESESGGLDALPGDVLKRLKDLTSEAQSSSLSNATTIQLVDKELETTYRKFYEFVYADLPYCWRLLYTDLALLKFSLLVLENAADPDEQTEDEDEDGLLSSLVAILDKALILAGGAGRARGRKTIAKLLAHLEPPSPGTTHRFPRTFPATRTFTPPVTSPIGTVENMSMAAFQRYLDDSDGSPEPLVLRGLMSDWPARSTRPWDAPAYLMSRTCDGRRLVPVEVGRSYVDEGWTQELIPFRELLSRIIDASASTGTNGKEENKTTTTTYLAQHELFSQLPHLQNDILTPDHAFTNPPPHPLDPSKNKPELDLPLVNAWLGPAGTITPLHTDGYHNLLCQVVGAKYLRLYAPPDSEALCPRFDGDGEDDGDDGDAVDMSNTSAFDVGAVEGWDENGEDERDPIELEEFRGLRHWDCVLEAGDVLYIPMGWWHYVRSLSVSFSVSFWWNGDHFIQGD